MKNSESGKVVERPKPDDQATGDGTRFIKLGGAVRYHLDDLTAFIEENRRASTTDHGAKADTDAITDLTGI